MSKPTPGPWEIAPYNGLYTRFIVAGEGCLVADCWPLVEPYYRDSNDRRYKSPRKPNEANARLIAAAPELLNALKGMLEGFDVDDKYSSDAVIKSRAAIKKATGEE